MKPGSTAGIAPLEGGLALRWSRRFITAFWTTAVLMWVWAMPGIPLGLKAHDYSERVVSALLLCAVAIVTAAAALLLRSRVNRTDAEIRRLAFYDTLTGMANRALLMDRLEHAALQPRGDQRIGVLFVDLDQFKMVNDRFGHAAGDQVLVALSDRLNRSVRAGDTISRFGGDEFVVLLENIDGVGDALRSAEKIIAQLQERFWCDGHDIYLSASIGVAVSDGKPFNAENLLSSADLALYEAKASGRGKYAVFGTPPLAVPAPLSGAA